MSTKGNHSHEQGIRATPARPREPSLLGRHGRRLDRCRRASVGDARSVLGLLASARTGRICLIRSVVVSTLLTGGAEKGPSFSYSPPRSSSLKKLSPDSNAFDSASYLTTVFIVMLGGCWIERHRRLEFGGVLRFKLEAGRREDEVLIGVTGPAGASTARRNQRTGPRIRG
jgi:hypothetical protein